MKPARLFGYSLLLLLYPGMALPAATYHDQPESPMDIEEKLHAAYLAKGPAYQPRTEHFNEDGTPHYINRLILEDSPYLLQHAHNPVDWHAWSKEAFEQARREHKPVFLSIGYATCHWCHVMEQESFENPAIATLLNEHFISIKVDRETHPDIDQVYMTAVTLLTGQGGWPMSSFLTPQGKPFYGGTYFPPKQFTNLLKQVSQVWHEQHDEVEAQAGRIAEAVAESNRLKQQAGSLDPAIAQKASALLRRIFDEIQGGFGQAPKFPQEPWLFLLLDQAERHNDAQALEMLETTLDYMARGGIYDQVGGGFHRYSTDYEWLVPHFEKMLYNQAHLSRLYLGANRLTGKLRYLRVARQTLDYVLREMTAPEGGFYSATDADSEGEEGLFFTWTLKEIRDALAPEDAALVKSLYDVSRMGNFEGRNILHLEEGLEDYAAAHKMNAHALRQRMDHINSILLNIRNQRVAPLRDDKIITAWNGMMITAFAEAAGLLGAPAYQQAAERAADFLWQHNRHSPGRLWRVHFDGRSSIIATLEDYAYFGEAMLALYDLSGERQWLERASELADVLTDRFIDKENGGFFMNEAAADITAMGRPRDDGADGAIPSGSSAALHLLQGLWLRTGKVAYGEWMERLISRFAASIEAQPHAYGYMLTAINQFRQGELGPHNYAAQGGIRLNGRVIADPAGALRLKVRIEIPQGWHINSNQPGDKSLIATQLQLTEQTNGWSMGPVNYPQGEKRQLAFQATPQSLYSGSVTLEATLFRQLDEPARQTVPVSIRLQACNDQVCLPPEQPSLRLSLP